MKYNNKYILKYAQNKMNHIFLYQLNNILHCDLNVLIYNFHKLFVCHIYNNIHLNFHLNEYQNIHILHLLILMNSYFYLLKNHLNTFYSYLF